MDKERGKMVLPDRIELSTSPLPMECSTTELRQRAPDHENRPKGPYKAGRSLPQGPGARKRADRAAGVFRRLNQCRLPIAGPKSLNCGSDPVPGFFSRRRRRSGGL